MMEYVNFIIDSFKYKTIDSITILFALLGTGFLPIITYAISLARKVVNLNNTNTELITDIEIITEKLTSRSEEIELKEAEITRYKDLLYQEKLILEDFLKSIGSDRDAAHVLIHELWRLTFEAADARDRVKKDIKGYYKDGIDMPSFGFLLNSIDLIASHVGFAVEKEYTCARNYIGYAIMDTYYFNRSSTNFDLDRYIRDLKRIELMLFVSKSNNEIVAMDRLVAAKIIMLMSASPDKLDSYNAVRDNISTDIEYINSFVIKRNSKLYIDFPCCFIALIMAFDDEKAKLAIGQLERSEIDVMIKGVFYGLRDWVKKNILSK